MRKLAKAMGGLKRLNRVLACISRFDAASSASTEAQNRSVSPTIDERPKLPSPPPLLWQRAKGMRRFWKAARPLRAIALIQVIYTVLSKVAQEKRRARKLACTG